MDFLCLQETHSTSAREFSRWLRAAIDNKLLSSAYSCISSPGTNRSSGVAIIYKSQYLLTSSQSDQQGRFVCGQFTVADQTFSLCNVYGPNKAREGALFFESLYPVLDPDIPSIVCGDFNTVVDPHLDRRGCNIFSPWAYNWSHTLTTFMSTFSLHDVWRRLHPDAEAYTWHRPNSRQASRLDMFWIASFFLPLILAVDILPFFRSDHSYVYLKFSLPGVVHRGPGVWKLNTSHMSDPSFILLITRFWESWQAEKRSFSFLTAWWDAGKVRLQRLIKSYSKRQASTYRKQVRSLERTLYFLDRRSENGEDVAGLLSDTKSELEELHRQRARGCCLRAGVQWAEEGEASTAYFFNLERKRGQERLFSAIRTLGDIVVRSVSLIARAWVSFYVLLFTAQPLVVGEQDFFLSQLDRRLSAAERALCEGELTLEECKAAVDGMASGKSPGVDGLPAEFYQRFWPLLGADLVEVLNYAYTTGRLSPSQRSGLITLLHKRGDHLEMKNWRPITLLCADYKIAAKAIANRLLEVLPTVVHPDQSCGVRGRDPVVNRRMLQDLVHDVNHRGLGGAVLSLDQEKAFDRVDWGFLLRVLDRMNFGSSFCKWVNLFYTRISSSVLVNGERSESFFVSRGVRQGCPLSPLLYVLMAETIASAIRNDPHIDGFSLPGRRCIKLCQYADDTSIVVMSDFSLEAVFKLFQRYERASGAKLNVTKTHGLLLGTWASRQSLPVALDWSSHSITVMGAKLMNVLDDSNWTAPLEAFDQTLDTWRQRRLSYHGRALVLNSLGLSTFWYLVSFLTMSSKVRKAVRSTAFSFLWNEKRERVARSSLTQPSSSGGLNVVDLDHKISAFHVTWVRRLAQAPDHPGFFFFSRALRVAFAGRSLQQILLLPAPSQTAMNLLPPFFRSVMMAWFRLSRRLENGNIVVDGSGSVVPLASLSVRFAYRQFSRLAREDHRCVAAFRSWGMPVEWSSVWSNLHLWRFVRPVRDTNWLIAHGVLPTADRLIRFGVRIHPSCHCGQAESLIHLLVECPVAKRLLAWYQSLVRSVVPRLARPTPSQILLGYDKSVKIPPVFPCLLGLIRHRLWIARNAFRFDGSPVVFRSLLALVKSSLRFTLRVQQRHCPRDLFVESWLAGGVLGHVTPDNIIAFSAGFS